MNAEITLDFTIIKEQLAGYALSEGARSRLLALTPSMKEGLCYSQLEETTRARRALDEYGTPPLTAMPEIEKIIYICNRYGAGMDELFADVDMDAVYEKLCTEFFGKDFTGSGAYFK